MAVLLEHCGLRYMSLFLQFASLTALRMGDFKVYST